MVDNQTNSIPKLSLSNKIQAFLILPILSALLSGVLYSILVLGDIRGQGVLAFGVTPFLYFLFFVPVFEKLKFKLLFITYENLSFVEKTKKHKAVFVGFGVVTLFFTFFALYLH